MNLSSQSALVNIAKSIKSNYYITVVCWLLGSLGDCLVSWNLFDAWLVKWLDCWMFFCLAFRWMVGYLIGWIVGCF